MYRQPDTVASRLEAIRSLIPEGVQLVAVSKFHPVSAIKEAYDAGQRRFGESRVQELCEKIPQLPRDIEWHFIGHLQTNKVKQLVGKTSLIESVDSTRLLKMIDEESRKKDIVAKILLQVHVAAEETKFGFTPSELIDFFSSKAYESLSNTHISGLMAMASNTDDEDRIKKDFRKVAELFNKIKTSISPELRDFDTLSMGMSGDWPLAVAEGADMVRIGSAIFGERVY